MRLSHPYVFVVGVACVALFFALVSARRVYLELTWRAAQRRRATWSKRVARVKSCRQVTDNECLLELVIKLDGEADYRAAQPTVTLRGIACLPGGADEGAELPVRVESTESWRLVVDLRALFGEKAEEHERRHYIERGDGLTTFKPVA